MSKPEEICEAAERRQRKENAACLPPCSPFSHLAVLQRREKGCMGEVEEVGVMA